MARSAMWLFLLPLAGVLGCQPPWPPYIITYEIYPSYEESTKSVAHRNIITTKQDVQVVRATRQNFLELCKGLLKLEKRVQVLEITDGRLALLGENFLEDQNVVEAVILSRNKISILKRHTFVDLPLEVLKLDQNKIQAVEAASFVNLTRLTALFLWENRLKAFNGHELVHVPSLHNINLDRNHLEVVQNCSFAFLQNQTAIIHISLNGNRIWALEANAFGCVKGATDIVLVLRSNRLTVVPDGVFDELPFSVIQLQGNPLRSRPSCAKKCNSDSIEMDPVFGSQSRAASIQMDFFLLCLTIFGRL